MRSESCSFIWHPKVVRWYFFIPCRVTRPPTSLPSARKSIGRRSSGRRAHRCVASKSSLRLVDAAARGAAIRALASARRRSGDLDVPPRRPLRRSRASPPDAHLRDRGGLAHSSSAAPTAGAGVLPAHHPGVRRDRDRPHLVRPSAAADHGGDARRSARDRARAHFDDLGATPAREEVQRAQRSVRGGRRSASGWHLRGRVPPRTRSSRGVNRDTAWFCDHRRRVGPRSAAVSRMAAPAYLREGQNAARDWNA